MNSFFVLLQVPFVTVCHFTTVALVRLDLLMDHLDVSFDSVL